MSKPNRHVADIAKHFGISVRSMERAGRVRRCGIPEIETAIMAGDLTLGVAEKIIELPRERQLAELQRVLAGGSTKTERTLETDVVQIEKLIRRLSKNWSSEERPVARMAIIDLVRHLLSDES